RHRLGFRRRAPMERRACHRRRPWDEEMSAIDWKSLPTAAGMRAGSVRQAVCAEHMSAVRVETAPDAVFDGKTHWHDNEQMLVMISGEVTLVIDDRTFVCRPGDLVFFPPGSRHAAIAVGPE